jgi:hypothetical protein
LSAGLETLPNQHARSNGGTSKTQTLAAAGISKTEAHRCEKILARNLMVSSSSVSSD